ncbi:class I adenylate-forming enzyme family protein [Prevotella sp. AGR2160]|uniref:class I adenylate-forming enzyme family protein n=1 Tax=Prevotella sp. AGR2160 TaxID=1280674 RepID=UPI00040968D6|nr:class I adenylate-forming enzyme family protein [Prevotella sp. AGR2160]
MEILESFLRRHAETMPEKTAVICGSERLSYGELWQRVERAAADYEPHHAYPFRNTQDIHFLVTYLAIHVAGAVAIPLAATGTAPDISALPEKMPDGIADILYTTGTTGRQKGVMISHRALLADAENLIDAQGFKRDTIFVICGPMNHIGSLSKLWPVIHEGGTLVILEGLRDLQAFFDAFTLNIDGGKSERRYASFLVPASIRLLLQVGSSELQAIAPTIDFIETGAAPMPQSDLEAISAILPQARLYNTYASTETGIITTYDFNHNPCVAGCLGRPMRHSRLFITPEGTVACQGPTLMSGYVGDAAATAAILHDDTLWTQDIGEIDGDGNLRLIGRNGDTINIGGYKVAPTDVENAALSLEGLTDCMCVKASSPIFGETLKLLYVADRELTKPQIARHLAARLERWQVPNLYEQVERIPRTFNGKLDRKGIAGT